MQIFFIDRNRIRATKNLSTDADSRTDIFVFAGVKKGPPPKGFFLPKQKKMFFFFSPPPPLAKAFFWFPPPPKGQFFEKYYFFESFHEVRSEFRENMFSCTEHL